MRTHNLKRFLCLVLTLCLVLPSLLVAPMAAETAVVVDDTVTDSSLDHYFTYTEATDANGEYGWAADTKGSIATVGTTNAAGNDVAQTQHWVWSMDYSEASKHTYTFTFKGTGVEIVGVKNDATNNFQLDDGQVETVAITGAANTPVVLYSVTGLEYGTHTVAATLPEGGTGLQVCYANVYGAEDSGNEGGTVGGDEVEVIKTKIPHTQTTGESNYFTYSQNGWSAMGQSPEHVWSDDPSANPEAVWYTVTFVGHAIDVYAGKNWPMGYVAYYIDDTYVGEFNLYQSSNSNSLFITKIDGLEEGEHVFKAVATGKNGLTSGSTNDLIDCAEVYVYHAPYVAESIILAETAVSLAEGATKQIKYTTNPGYAELSDVVYTSSDEDVATVSAAGVITAVGAGNATITVSSEISGLSEEIAVTVTEAIPGIAGSIVDVDTQWTQNRYDEVKGLGVQSAALTAWKNDIAVSELALVSVDSALKNVTVTASDFTGSAGTIAASNVTATFIRSTKAYNGGYTFNNYPVVTESNRSESADILWSTEPANMAYNAVQPVWVEIAVPKDAAAGTYTGTLTVTADDLEGELTFTYTLTVQDVTLPDATSFANTFDVELWQYPYSVAEYYGVEPFSEEHFDALRSVMGIYKSIGGHAITTTIQEEAWSGQTYSTNAIHYPSMIKWEKINGVMTYDYTHFDAWVSFCKEMGIGDKIVLYSIAPWHNTIKYWENGVLKSEGNYFGNITTDAMWEHFLNDLIDHLEEKGWFDDAYIGIDERGFSAAAFDLIESVTNDDGECLKTAGAMDAFVDKWSLALRVTDLNVGDTAVAEAPARFAELVEVREAKGYRTTLYSCTGHQPGNFSLCAPVESYWIILNAGMRGGAGFLRWAYDAWVADPLNDTTHSNFEAGDCFLIFPDEKDAVNPTARPSVRLARIAQGVRDVNKLMYIEQNAPSLADDVDAVYANITDLLGHYGVYTCPSTSTVVGQTTAFQADLNALTNEYIALMAANTEVVESVTIDQGETLDLVLGSTATLTATVLPDNLLNDTVIWTSSNESIVVVNNGTVTGKGQGTATVTAASAADPTKTDSITITVDLLTVDESKLYAYYTFDNIEGTTVADEWNDHDATMQTGAATAAGKSGNALSVTTAGVGAIVEDNDELNTDWTVAYWVNTTANFSGEISVMEDADRVYSLSLKMAADRNSGFRVGNNSGDVLTYNYNFQPNTWYYLTWVQDKDVGLSMYVNGALVQSNNWPVTHTVKSPIDVIGGTGFTGLIDEVKIYNAPLTAEEINAIMQVPGVNLAASSIEIDTGDTYQIEATVISENSDKSLSYESSDPAVATVSSTGKVTGVTRGTAVITVTNAATGYTAELTVKVIKQVNIHNVLDRYVMPEEYLSTIERAPGTNRQYLGQPDMIQTKTGRLIMSYPIGHGKGPLVMRISDDGGITWTEKTDIPASWANSQETPTLYVLNVQGEEVLMLITACPGWGAENASVPYGWNVSVSRDNGDTWSEYENFWPELNKGYDGDTFNEVIVGMASLVQLKDKDGNNIEKWMGVYHDYQYANYKTYLTFNDDGSMNWSEPELYLSEHRSIEASHQMCEIGMFRSPDGSRIVGLARSQSHNHLSTMIWSDDEGETWSEPVELPGSLAGERHKAHYDPISGKLVITFREIQYDRDGDGMIESGDWYCGDWGLWVGTYEDLMALEDGEYCVTIDEDFTKNTYSGDTGYAGYVILDDGTFVMSSYGHWDDDFSSSWNGGVTTDLCYIRQARFTLADLEHSLMGEGDHRCTVEWNWANDYSSATATFACEIPECEYTETLNAEVTYDADSGLYTATVIRDGVDYTDNNNGEPPAPDMPETVEVNLEVGKTAKFTDDTGDYGEADTSALDESVATVELKSVATYAGSTLGQKVTAVESGKTYVLYNTAAQKLMNNQWADASVGAGGTNGLGLSSTTANIQKNDYWTITAVNGGYYVQDMDGKYLTVARGKAGVSDTAVVISLAYDGTDWTIGESGEYLNDFGGAHTAVAGWSDINDDNSQWYIYAVTAVEEYSTEIIFTGVGAGETSVRIADTIYNVTVTDPNAEVESVVTRLSGSGRCETAYLAANELKAALGVEKFDAVIIASGDNFADALAGSYLAAVKGAPILLYRNGYAAKNAEYIAANLKDGGTVYILGGTAAVPEEMETALAGYMVKRVKGANRFETNLAILEEAGVGDKDILVATGYNFADSLSASATGMPILLVHNSNTDLTETQKAFLEGLNGNNIVVIGGTGAVNEDLYTALEAYGNVERVKGSGREATSVAIAEKYFDAPEAALVAYSRNFPDGLCGGPLAYALGAPLLLTNTGYENVTAAYTASEGITDGFVLGGTAAVSDEIVRTVFAMANDAEITVKR